VNTIDEEVSVSLPAARAKRYVRRRSLFGVVLAAGRGERMRSSVPKPLQRICGKEMISWVLEALDGLGLDRIVVVAGAEVDDFLKVVGDSFDTDIELVRQVVPKGTGDAMKVALTALPDPIEHDEDADVVVVPADAPLITTGTLAALVRRHRSGQAAATMVVARLADPTGYGRVVRNRHGKIERVVEERDAAPEMLATDEVCTSIYAFKLASIGPALRRISPRNAQGEYYLTDVIGVLSSAGYEVESLEAEDLSEVMGVNDKAQLAEAERVVGKRIADELMRAGVRMVRPETIYVEAQVRFAGEATILPHVLLTGSSFIGEGATIGPHAMVEASVIGNGASVECSVVRFSEVARGAKVGPFSYVGPGARVGEDAVVRPFEWVQEA
jgi:bifunctional UDP-N-acetylglucosamine pyrophosphorylase/glucosamine-1-phosphate N-acetyltransferase